MAPRSIYLALLLAAMVMLDTTPAQGQGLPAPPQGEEAAPASAPELPPASGP
jgi:hypothetical protein